jgi:hypothetical protein
MTGVGQLIHVETCLKSLVYCKFHCVHVLSLKTFLVNNFDKFQINNSMHMINTRINDHLHLPVTCLSSHQRGG